MEKFHFGPENLEPTTNQEDIGVEELSNKVTEEKEIKNKEKSPRKRKPNGYWQNLPVEDLIREEIESHGFDPENLPQARVLRDKHPSLYDELVRRFGSFPNARVALGGEILKKPNGYWQNLPVEDLIREEIESRGLNPKNLPSVEILKDRHNDLLQGLTQRFGSFPNARVALGGEILKKRKGYWRNLPVEDFINEEIEPRGLDPKNLPSSDYLGSKYPDLFLGLTQRFGSFPKARVALGGEVLRKPSGYWPDLPVEDLIREEIESRGLDPKNLPSYGYLRDKYSDLLHGLIRRFGGYSEARIALGGEVLRQSGDSTENQNVLELEKTLQSISTDETPEAAEIQKVLSIFGGDHSADILFRFHPEYKTLPVEKVKSVIGRYLGDFLNQPRSFVIGDLDEVSASFLERTDFQETLFEVLRRYCTEFYGRERKKDASVPHEVIVARCIGELKAKTIALQSPQVSAVIQKLESYYEDLFVLTSDKPEQLIEQLTEGRPFPDFYQMMNVKELSDKKRMLIADEMGMGKSASAILSKEYIGSKKALVVVPSNVISTWETYLSDRVAEDGKQQGYFKKGQSPKILTIERPEDLDDPAVQEAEYVLISHERMSESYVQKLKFLGYDMLIIDEVHELKNLTGGQRAKNVAELADTIQDTEGYLVALSGTPVPNKARDVAMLLRLLYPEQFSEVSEKELVANIINGDLIDIRNLLIPRMQMKSLQESVEMPKLKNERLATVLSEAEKDIYELLLEEDELTASEKIINFRRFLMNPRALELTPDIKGTKIRDVEKKLGEVFQDRDKVVLFVNNYVEGIIRGEDSIIEQLDLPDDITIRVIDGTTPKDERQRIQEDLSREGKMLLVVSGDTAGVGVDFSNAEHVVFYNEPWTVYEKKQQTSRVYRPGLKDDLTVTTSVTEGTIEEGIEEYIDLKYTAIQKILNGVPITEIEKNILKTAERERMPQIEGDPEIAREWLNAPSNRLHRFFGMTKGAGEESFRKFLLEHGDEYADCYLDMGGRGFQANTARVAGTLIDHFVEESGQDKEALTILDLASGPEMLKTHIGNSYKERVVSLDINPLHFFGKTGKVIAASFLNVPMKDESMDYINLSLALHYARLNLREEKFEPIQILTEINRILKPGGRVVLSLLYSLRFKDEEKFMKVVETLGFRVVDAYTGDVESGSNYHSNFYTLEKVSEVEGDIDEVIGEIGLENVDGVKEVQSGRESLNNGRKIINQFHIQGKTMPVVFNEMDTSLFDEQQVILQEGEELKKRYGSIGDIPRDEIVSRGFLKYFNGKTYRLFKKSQKMGGFVAIR